MNLIEVYTLISFSSWLDIGSLEIVENNYLSSHLWLLRGKMYHCWSLIAVRRQHFKCQPYKCSKELNMIVPFVSFSVDVLVRFVSVMYCVVQNNKMSGLIHIVGFYFLILGPWRRCSSASRHSASAEICRNLQVKRGGAEPAQQAGERALFTCIISRKGVCWRGGRQASWLRLPLPHAFHACYPLLPAPSSLWSLIPERCGHWNVKSCALPDTDVVCVHYSEKLTVAAVPTLGVCAKIISCHQSGVER